MEAPNAPCCSSVSCCSDKKKCVLCGVVAVVLLFLVATAILFIGKQLGLKQVPLCSPCPARERCPQAVVPSSANPTAGWETYTNTEWGFSFKYPSSFEIITPITKGSLVNVRPKNGFGKCFGETNIDLFMVLIGLSSSIEQFKKNNASFSPNTLFEETNFNGEKAIRHYYAGSNQTGGPQVKLFFIHNDIGYEVLYMSCAKPDTIIDDSDMSPNILSTFRFD